MVRGARRLEAHTRVWTGGAETPSLDRLCEMELPPSDRWPARGAASPGPADPLPTPHGHLATVSRPQHRVCRPDCCKSTGMKSRVPSLQHRARCHEISRMPASLSLQGHSKSLRAKALPGRLAGASLVHIRPHQPHLRKEKREIKKGAAGGRTPCLSPQLLAAFCTAAFSAIHSRCLEHN